MRTSTYQCLDKSRDYISEAEKILHLKVMYEPVRKIVESNYSESRYSDESYNNKPTTVSTALKMGSIKLR